MKSKSLLYTICIFNIYIVQSRTITDMHTHAITHHRLHTCSYTHSLTPTGTTVSDEEIADKLDIDGVKDDEDFTISRFRLMQWIQVILATSDLCPS